MIIAFAGHSTICRYEEILREVKEQIQKNINTAEQITCYVGGYGEFDDLCAHACKELKNNYPQIEIVYVTPYISLSKQSRNQQKINSGLYDTQLYPPLENVPPRFAISKRNEWIITNSDLVIAYVNHDFGGAYKSFCFAKRKKKKIINIYDIIKSKKANLE